MLLSIIVPIFNGARFIGQLERQLRAVKSVGGAQIQLIVVNDCSTDDTVNLLTNLCDGDLIELINLDQNQGVSVARNEGLKWARAKYVTFFDVDDTINLDEFCGFYSEISLRTVTDVIIVDRLVVGNSSMDVELTPNAAVNLFANLKISNSVWGKVFRRDFLVSNNILFPVGQRIGEDGVFVLKSLLVAEKIEVSRSEFYIYDTKVAGSASATRVTDTDLEMFIAGFRPLCDVVNSAAFPGGSLIMASQLMPYLCKLNRLERLEFKKHVKKVSYPSVRNVRLKAKIFGLKVFNFVL